MKSIEIKKDVYWVGAIDWNLRNFHGYLTQRGTTYNAYLIIDDKITLIDTVKSCLSEYMMKRISEIIDPKKIDYIISNHVEMDHSGSLPIIKKYAENATIITSPKGKSGLSKHFNPEWDYKVVKTGDTFSTGKYSFNFVLTPMIHWPDNMVSYSPELKILFSNDAFGQHIASSERFDNEYPIDITIEEAKKYYANIVLPYSLMVKKALETVKTLDMEFIAPSHGIIWNKHIKRILENYDEWSQNNTIKKALIIYDTMWHSTEKIAYTIQEAFDEKKYITRILNLKETHISDIMTEVMTAEYICVGSPTLNNSILPTAAGFLAYMKGLAPKNRKGLAFGSFGWSGQSIGIVNQTLEECHFDNLEPIKINYIPSEQDLKDIKNKIKEQVK